MTRTRTTASARGRRRALRFGRPILALGAAGAVALLLAQNTAGAAFTGQTGNGADQVSSAASFCTSPGSTTLNPAADTTAYQSQPTTIYGTNALIGTISAVGGNARAFLRFTLPALPAGCTITAATLKLYAGTVVAGRTGDLYRVDPTVPLWTEAALNWNTQPPATGTAVSSASLSAAGWQQWTVTGLMAALYAGPNNGFVLRDHTESAAASAAEYYDSREGTNKPQLLLSWG